MNRLLISLVTTVTLCLVPVGCDVDVEDEGQLPDVDVEGGRMPDVDVDAPEIDVDTEEKTITVPDIDVDYPEEDDPDDLEDENPNG